MSALDAVKEHFGLRRASGVGEAGWGRTLFAGVVAITYFLPVLFIIVTSLKLQGDALAVPPKLFPFSLFGLIPSDYVFTPTLENFTAVFSRAAITGGAVENTGFDRFFLN